MKITRFPDPILFKKCKEVTVFGKELEVLLQTMYDTMIASGGLGLAANQVSLSYRMFVMELMVESKKEKIFFVNPKIIARSVAPADQKEGCLSAPGEFLVLAERSSWVQVEFQNEKGEKQSRVFKGIYAVCVQHEIDHLDGKSHLLSKSIPTSKRKELAKKWGIKLK